MGFILACQKLCKDARGGEIASVFVFFVFFLPGAAFLGNAISLRVGTRYVCEDADSLQVRLIHECS